jgi:6-phosphogluconolactonase (cycloisomerase 2 family)
MKKKISATMAIVSVSTFCALAQGTPGAVFTMDNSSNANHVLVFDRHADGSLSPNSQIPTGGIGTGAGLGSQGGVILSEGHRWLFVVNAGSHDISVFGVSTHGLQIVDRTDSGGLNPISLTVSGNVLYVLNADGAAGGTDNITGFQVSPAGKLQAIPDSTRGLSGVSTAPAQVGFSPDGTVLIVTEKSTSLIDTFAVDGEQNVPGEHQIFQSPGTEPFGFAFNRKNQLFVTEAPASTVSSYSVDDDGTLTLINESVPTQQKAACWMAVSKNGRLCYTGNTASNSTTGFHIAPDGSIGLVTPDGLTGATGAGTTDLTFSEDSRNLYTLDSKGGSISAFHVNLDGSLTSLPAAQIPVGSDGVAAY